jgi:hypothetical protein
MKTRIVTRWKAAGHKVKGIARLRMLNARKRELAAARKLMERRERMQANACGFVLEVNW